MQWGTSSQSRSGEDRGSLGLGNPDPVQSRGFVRLNEKLLGDDLLSLAVSSQVSPVLEGGSGWDRVSSNYQEAIRVIRLNPSIARSWSAQPLPQSASK